MDPNTEMLKHRPAIEREAREAAILRAENERLRATLQVVLSFGTTLPSDCREIVLEALNA